MCHACCCTISQIHFILFFSSIVACSDSAMLPQHQHSHNLSSSFFLTFNPKGQATSSSPFTKLSLAIYYHYTYCLNLCVATVFLICSLLQEAHKIKSALCTLCLDSHYICADILLPLVFRLQVCTTVGAVIAQEESFDIRFLTFLLTPVLSLVFIQIRLNWLVRFLNTVFFGTRFVKCRLAKKCCFKKKCSLAQ